MARDKDKERDQDMPQNAKTKTTRGFPVTSPTYEVKQFRKSRQATVERLTPGTIVRFSSPRVDGGRGGDAHALYATQFVIERLEGNEWVTCSKPLGQGELSKRICIVTQGDPDDPTILDRFDSWDKPLMVLSRIDDDA